MVDVQRLTEIRARWPEVIGEAYARRRRRAFAGGDGRLMIIAADHPARGALAAGGRADAMADRQDLLSRLLVALGRPGVDGLLAAPDVVEDMLLLGALDDKLIIGSMNRGGLPGAAFEVDDRFTAYDVDSIRRHRLDGGKLLLRIDPEDRATAEVLERSAAAVTALAAERVPIMVEPFLARRGDDGLVNDLTTDAVVRSAAIASALGNTSAYTWLKLPVVDDPSEMERVAAATTLPIVLLGGEVSDDPDATLARWQKALELPAVRGLTVGRSLLYPPDGDVAAAVDRAVSLLPGRGSA